MRGGIASLRCRPKADLSSASQQGKCLRVIARMDVPPSSFDHERRFLIRPGCPIPRAHVLPTGVRTARSPPDSATRVRTFRFSDACSYALDTKDMTIFEMAQANDGRQGGKFLERTKARYATPTAFQAVRKRMSCGLESQFYCR